MMHVFSSLYAEAEAGHLIIHDHQIWQTTGKKIVFEHTYTLYIKQGMQLQYERYT